MYLAKYFYIPPLFFIVSIYHKYLSAIEFYSIVAPFVWHWYAKEKQSHLRVTAFGCGKLKKLYTIWKPKPGKTWLK